jgi:hypothetical protein
MVNYMPTFGETQADRYNRQYANQEGVCNACGEHIFSSRFLGVPTMQWAHQISTDAPHELICISCANALKAANKTAAQRRADYVARYTEQGYDAL